MTPSRTDLSVSRRTAISGLGAGGLGLALAVKGAAAQDATADMATHPIVGAWLVPPRDPNGGFDTVVFGADGSVVQGFAASAFGPAGVVFSSPGVGTWEPTGPRSAAFTAVTVNSDVTGTNLGTVTLDGHPDVREDGMTFVDDAPESTVTIRDKGGAVVMRVPALPASGPVVGTRIRVKSPGFHEGTPTPAEATPAT